MPLTPFSSPVTPPASRRRVWLWLLPLAGFAALFAMAQTSPTTPKPAADAKPAADPKSTPAAKPTTDPTWATATFGAGCFWCTQAVLQRVEGIKEVTCGYMGGTVKNPTYEEVCTGATGHAEVVQVKFDPAVISYDHLLEWFWKLHDPTTKNQQGNDVGTQYRSVIFYYDDAQKAAAEKSMAAAQIRFIRPIVTEIVKAGDFWPAEDYHQDYFNKHPTAGYCSYIIAPKLDHLNMDLSTSAPKKVK